MRLLGKTEKSSSFFLLSLLLGLFFLGPGGFLFAELDEPPQGTEQAGAQTLGEALQGDEDQRQGRRTSSGDREILEDLRRGVLISVSWIFLGVGLVLVSLTLRKTYLWLMAVHKARVPPTRYFNLQLQVRGREGNLSLHSFDYYPVVVAAGGTADLLLPGFSDSEARFRIDYHHGQAHLSSDPPILVNGVPRRQKPLKQDDRIVFGPYRVDFKDASVQEQTAPVPGKPVFAWQFPIVALLLALSVLFKQAGAVPENTMLLAKAAQLQSAEQSSRRNREPVRQESAFEEPVIREKRPLEAAVREPVIREQKPAEAAIAKADTSVSRATRAEESSFRRKDASEDTAAARTDSHLLRSAAEDPAPSRQTLTAPEPAPARRPAVSREPPVDAVAEVPAPRSFDVSPVREEGSTLSHRRANQQPAMLQASVLGTVAPAAMQNDGINPLEALSFIKKRSRPDIGRTKVRVIAPGRPVEYFKTDILFIHAHPDDESIDFGSLMARASRSNKRIVTLLFTDGESGLDLYPQRKVGDIYPARVLKGGALSQVRVVEATRALSILGSEMYLRWGLENRPYNTQRDVVPPEEVIRGWGGEEQLVARLIEVLEGFQPAIVVSPDSRSEAYEHFEHEAVGQVVQSALERLRRGGKSYVKGHLVSIDPYQADRYTGVTAVDAQIQDGESGFAYRAIQALALNKHVTQRDASVIGVSRLSHLPQEFYKALFWDLDESFEEYLK
ncbi:MAG: PIG-L family deacetylase [Spirochaetales bacterium]|nr:PIG-L family deacetylase [Spirochaetales bacterium]